MKRKVFVAVLVICLMLSACGKEAEQGTLTNEKSNFEFSPNKYHLFNATLVETEQFFVGGQPGGQYLYYYDKATGYSDFLCADPSCSHNSRNCGAFIAQTGLATFYEGNRYWIEDRTEENMLDSSLWRSDLDGKNRQKIKSLPFESVGQYAPQLAVAYQGKLYMMGSAAAVDGVTVGMRVSLLRTSLDADGAVEILFDENYPAGERSRMVFVGNTVYFGVRMWTDARIYSVKVVKIDIETLHTETVYEETEITEMIGTPWVTEKGEIFFPGADRFWKVENDHRVEVSKLVESTSPASIDDDVVIQTYADDGIRYVEIRNLDGGLIYQGKLFPEGVDGLLGDMNTVNEYGLTVFGGDPEKLVVSVMSFGLKENNKSGEMVNYPEYFIQLDLQDNMKPTLLWTATK